MTDDVQKDAAQPFLSRWSQRKQQAREQPAAEQPVERIEMPAPDLPPIEELTPQSDFSVFMHPKVDPDLRRAALKKLFSDPHFNVMDGLDTYIEDYSKPDPLPPGMLAGLRQAQNILAWAKETREETAARFAPPLPEGAMESQEEQALLPAENTAPPPASDQAPDSASVAAAPVENVTPPPVQLSPEAGTHSVKQ